MKNERQAKSTTIYIYIDLYYITDLVTKTPVSQIDGENSQTK